ncbi:MAG: hypothetical protein IJT62_03620 [Oscillospiraceae bacterium]|nr:hypothetical protein [Oscillospiraceae bacterium]
MFGTMQFYLFIVLGIFLVGEIVGIATKGKLSGIMVAFIIFLVGFLSGILPADIIDKAGLTIIAKWCPAMVIFNLGTGVNIRQLIREWRTLAMACVCMICSIIIILCVSPLIGLKSALVAIPVVNGGTIATQIMTQGAIDKGLTIAAALAAVVYALQKLVGAPLASYFGVREANNLLEEFRKDPAAHMAALQSNDKGGEGAKKVPFYQKYQKYYSSTVMIGVTALFAWIAKSLDTFTGVNYGIWALILGALCNSIGIAPPKLLDQSKSTGILMIAMFGSIIPALAKVSLGDIGTLLFQVVVIFASAVAGIFLAGWVLPTWKICGSRNLAIGIGVEQFLGFPTNVVLVREIATATGKTEQERDYIESKLGTPYVIAGFATVTTVSVLIAGIVVDLL